LAEEEKINNESNEE
jgi:hypothetical protein